MHIFICVGELTIIGSDNGLSPGRHQAIIWTNAGILLIRTSFSEILGEIHTFSFKKMQLQISSAKRRPFCQGGDELINLRYDPRCCNICPGYCVCLLLLPLNDQSYVFLFVLWLLSWWRSYDRSPAVQWRVVVFKELLMVYFLNHILILTVVRSFLMHTVILMGNKIFISCSYVSLTSIGRSR